MCAHPNLVSMYHISSSPLSRCLQLAAKVRFPGTAAFVLLPSLKRTQVCKRAWMIFCPRSRRFDPLDISVVLDMHDEVVQSGLDPVDLLWGHEVKAYLASENGSIFIVGSVGGRLGQRSVFVLYSFVFQAITHFS